MRRFLGIDLHSNNFVVCYYTTPKNYFFINFMNNSKELEKFINTLNKNDRVAVEATTNSKFFIEKIKSYVNEIIIVTPSKFSILSSSNKKTDKNDAYLLAQYLSKDLLPQSSLKSSLSMRIMSMCKLREILVNHKTQLINKTHFIVVANGYKIEKYKLRYANFENNIYQLDLKKETKLELERIERYLKQLIKDINELEKDIQKKVQLFSGYKNIISIKGIGPISAAILLSTIDDITRFPDKKNLCSYFGIVPKIKKSNKITQKLGMTKQGCKFARKTLIQCTWVSIKYSPYLRSHYERKKNKSCAQIAIVSCAKKLLHIIYYILKEDLIFEDFVNYKFK